MNYNSLTNEELIRHPDDVPTSLWAERLAESMETEWTEERCNEAYEDGARDGAKESDEAHSNFLASVANDLEAIADSLDYDGDTTKVKAQVAALTKRIWDKL